MPIKHVDGPVIRRFSSPAWNLFERSIFHAKNMLPTFLKEAQIRLGCSCIGRPISRRRFIRQKVATNLGSSSFGMSHAVFVEPVADEVGIVGDDLYGLHCEVDNIYR